MVNCFSLGGNTSPRPGIELTKDLKSNFAILNGVDRFLLTEEPRPVSQDTLYDPDAIAEIFEGQIGPWVGTAPDGKLILYACEIGEHLSVKSPGQCQRVYVYVLGGLQNEMYSLGDSNVIARWFDLQKNTQEILVEMNTYNSSAIALGGMVIEYRGNGKFVSS